MGLISQEKAKELLRREAGFSYEEAAKCVRELPKKLDGKREKVKQIDVQRIIRETNMPTVILDPANSLLSKRVRERIRRNAERL